MSEVQIVTFERWLTYWQLLERWKNIIIDGVPLDNLQTIIELTINDRIKLYSVLGFDLQNGKKHIKAYTLPSFDIIKILNTEDLFYRRMIESSIKLSDISYIFSMDDIEKFEIDNSINHNQKAFHNELDVIVLLETQLAEEKQKQQEGITTINAEKWGNSDKAALSLLVEIMQGEKTDWTKDEFTDALRAKYPDYHTKVLQNAWQALPAEYKAGAGRPAKKP